MENGPNQDEASTQADSNSELEIDPEVILIHIKLFQACLCHIQMDARWIGP